MARRYVIIALGYAILGMLLGIHMAMTQNHGQLVTHAHILLVGFVVSFVYGLLYRVWNLDDSGMLQKIQFYCHQAGTLIMIVGLYLLYGIIVAPDVLEPVLAIGSLLVLAAMIMMKITYLKGSKPRT
jgi:uncharacterized membrane protein